MKKFTHFSAVLFLSAGFILNAYANEPQTQKGSKSMYVSINSLTDLSFDDTHLGGQYLFADRQGINAEIGFISNTNEVGDVESTTSSLYFSVGYINYLFQNGPVAFYLNPYVGISSGKDESHDIETSGFDIGVGIGSEWWAFENVSLAVDVNLGFSSWTSKNTEINFESKSSSFGIIGSGGRFYLSFYF